ncbi:MAG: peptidoglycan-binding domain-containing protein [Bacillota bacterium]
MAALYHCTAPSFLHPIRAMQEYLRYISRFIPEVDSVIPDGVYGEETMQSVLSFQKYFDLDETGIIDYPTWEMISFVYWQLKTVNS